MTEGARAPQSFFALMLFRHLLAIVVFPVTMAILVPVWIADRYDVLPVASASAGGALLQIAGSGLLLAGLVLFLACVLRFAKQGRGTLAPWDPPRRLVIDGPYRFVRNPMISGVILVLFGEALILHSIPHAIWGAIFVAVNLTYIPLLEEPQLEARFGDDYRSYKKHVGRLLPRLSPWEPEIVTRGKVDESAVHQDP